MSLCFACRLNRVWESVDNYYIKTLTNRYREDTTRPVNAEGERAIGASKGRLPLPPAAVVVVVVVVVAVVVV